MYRADARIEAGVRVHNFSANILGDRKSAARN